MNQKFVDHDATDQVETVIACPVCFEATDSLKTFRALDLCYFLFVWTWSYESIAGCPSCMRKELIARLFRTLLLANLLYPFVAFSCTDLIALSRKEGHSHPDQAEAFRITRMEQERLLSEKLAMAGNSRDKASRREVLTFVTFVISAIAVALACYFLLAWRSQ